MYLLFADDIVLQKQISLIWGYCRLWQLIVSLPKSKEVMYKKGYADETYEFKIGEDRLEISESYKYLGLWCSNTPVRWSSSSNELWWTFMNIHEQLSIVHQASSWTEFMNCSSNTVHDKSWILMNIWWTNVVHDLVHEVHMERFMNSHECLWTW